MLDDVSELLLDRTRCSVAGTLAVVGEKWSLLVLREAFLGVRRFADFQRILGAPRAVLTDRLATLVEQSILRRVPYQAEGERQRHEYRLTEKGRDLLPAVIALMQWGDKWEADRAGPPVEVVHRDCGHPVELTLRCSDDQTPLTAHDTEPRPGPGSRPAKTGKTIR